MKISPAVGKQDAGSFTDVIGLSVSSGLTDRSTSTGLDLAWRIFLILLFKSSLDIATVFVSAEALGKYSIGLQVDPLRISVGYLAAILLAVTLPRWTKKISNLIPWLMVLFVGIPMLIPYQWGGGSFVWMVTCTLFWAALCAQTRISILRVAPLFVAGGWWPLAVFFGAVAAYSVLTSIFIAGLTPTLDFSIVYDIRRDFSAQQIPLGNYFYKWTAFIVAPLLFMLGQIHRSKVLVICSVAMALILFFATGHKTYLLILPFVYAVDWSVRRRRPLVPLIVGLSLLVLLGTATFYSFGDKRLNATFSNRLYVLPAKISYEYHEYFSEHRKIMLSHSILANALDYPYSASPQSLISGRYYSDPEGHPNTGILGDAFMNFGYGGVIVLWFMVAAVLRILSWLSVGKDPRLLLAMVIFPVFSWVNAGFLTSFLTAGLAFGMLGAFLLPRRTRTNKRWAVQEAINGGKSETGAEGLT